MRKWTLGGLVATGGLVLLLGACGGSKQASIPPVAPVVQPAPQPDMFASVPAEGDDTSSEQGAGGSAGAGKTDQADAGASKAEGTDADKAAAAKKEEAKPTKGKKGKKPAAKKHKKKK